MLPSNLHFQIRTSVPRGGSLAPAFRSAALANALTRIDAKSRVSVVVAAAPAVQDLLYTRVRELISLPEGANTDAHGDAAGRPDLIIVDEAHPSASIAAALAGGISVAERVDGRSLAKDGAPIAWRLHQLHKPVVEVSGEHEMLLDPALGSWRSARKPLARPPKELLILLGAGQHAAAELRIAEDLAPLAAQWERVDFVTGHGSTSAHRRQLGRLLPTARIIPGLTDAVPFLARADLAILSGATLAREAARLGAPTLLVSCTEADVALDQRFSAHGSALALGHVESLYPGLLAKTIKQIRGERLVAMAQSALSTTATDALTRLVQRTRALPIPQTRKALTIPTIARAAHG